MKKMKSENNLTLRDLQQRVDDWIKMYGVRYFSELTNMAILAEEVGEVARIIARKYGDQSFKESDKTRHLADEMADVLWVLACLANQTGVDLTDAFERNLCKKTERDSERHKNNQKVNNLLEKSYQKNFNSETLKQVYGLIDLTTLTTLDTKETVWQMVERVNAFEGLSPDMSNVAAICTYPVFTATVKQALTAQDVKIAAVSAGFPSSQTFPEVKVAETALAVMAGADEIDIVMNLGCLMEDACEEVADEIAEIKDACRDAKLKVILETGALSTPDNIRRATLLALYSGADFIKTSTGKGYPGATPEAVYTICRVIKQYDQLIGRKVGVKVSGGIRSAEDAVKYYTIVKELLGDEWLTKEYFRIGASSLVADIEHRLGLGIR